MNSEITSVPSDFDWDGFAEFLELPYEEVLIMINNAKHLSWFKRFQFKLQSKWWCRYISQIRKEGNDLKAITLWESMRKGRF